ncbi:MAG: aldo/keto reductase [Desulfurella sp.]|uniref:aldo/keto reductase n=1 Tax=Desulfurella sp. TaxID=1962857 RepID=UPI003CBE0A3A
MKYKKFGKTALKVSQLCLGTMTFGSNFYNIGAVNEELALELVKKAVNAGVNFFDTADVYSFGESETILGNVIKKLGLNRHEIVIATKVRSGSSIKAFENKGDINNIGLSRKHIFESIDASLKRLQIDYIDLYQIHGWDILASIEETLDALNDLVKMGKVLYIGCSNWSARHLIKALYLSKAKNLAEFVSLQAYYSLAGRDVEHELLPLCKEENLAFLPWSPLSGGFLTGKYTKENSKPQNARRSDFNFPPIDERAYDLIETLDDIAKQKGLSIAQLSLAWLLSKKEVTSVIIGANKITQLEDNLNSINIKLNDDEINALESVTRPKTLYPQWMYDRQNQNRDTFEY